MTNNPVRTGKETWKLLEQIQNRGNTEFFRDWLDMILNSLLALTEAHEHMIYSDCWSIDQIKFITFLTNEMNKGQYNDNYMKIVDKYQRHEKDKPQGTRTIDLMAQAWGQCYKETLETKKDILGEIFEKKVSLGEHGQFFTPEHITDVMSKIVMLEKSPNDKAETIMDPCCGSGRFLLSRAKENSDDYFIGQDIDERCCKMAAINLWIFNLNGEIRWGDSLTNNINKIWKIRKGGFIYQIDDITDDTKSDIKNDIKEKQTMLN